eukprot:2284943-Rhodomonas_salina.1
MTMCPGSSGGMYETGSSWRGVMSPLRGVAGAMERYTSCSAPRPSQELGCRRVAARERESAGQHATNSTAANLLGGKALCASAKS